MANRWLVIHVVSGIVVEAAIQDRLSVVAGSALIPLASLLVGLTFAWSGNAVALLQSEELQKVGRANGGETFRKWVFDYQLAILAVLVTTTSWALIAAGVVNNPFVMSLSPLVRHIGRTFMFALSSLTVRECWSVASVIQRKILTVLIVKGASAKAAGSSAVTNQVTALPERASSASVERLIRDSAEAVQSDSPADESPGGCPESCRN
jgi:hypothetical protein